MNRISTPAFIAATCAVMLSAGPAAAVDGEVLIGQGRVNAGGITPGDTAGFPATISRPGRYKLISNLVVPAGMNGIDVTAGDVAIDLNGFTIRGESPGQAVAGIYGFGMQRLRVSGGTIAGFQSNGIYADEAAVIENMRIISNGEGLNANTGSRVRNNTFANNSSRAVGCTSCVIEQNVITGNGSGFGGALHVASGATVIGNVIVGNQGIGLWSTGGIPPFSGYGNNILVGNNSGGAQVGGNLAQMHPNFCDPACP